MAEYKIEIYHLDIPNNKIVQVDEIITFQGLNFFSKLNGIGAAHFSLDVFDKKAIKSNLYRWKANVAIKRNGVPLFFGPIRKILGSFGSDSGTLNIECLSYGAHLSARFSDALETYTNIDASIIVTSMIQKTQGKTNGNLFIDYLGAINVGITNQTLEYKQIEDAINDKSDNVVSYYYDFLPVMDFATKKITGVSLSVKPSSGLIREDLPTLTLESNVSSLSFASNGEIINHVTAIGAGSGESVLTTISENVESQKAYSRREKIVKYSDVTNISTLQQKADAIITDGSVDKYTINLAIKPNSNISLDNFALGDVLKYKLFVKDTFIDFEGIGQVEEISVNYNNGVEYVTPKFRTII